MLSALLLLLKAAEPVSPPSPLSPQAQALIAPVHEALQKAEVAEAALPPATTTSERLERLRDRDQAGRQAMLHIQFTSLPEPERMAAFHVALAELQQNDLADQEELKSLIPPEGWFRRSVYGEKATKAAFLVVQHATNDPAFMRRTLIKIVDFVRQGEADSNAYALMYDRVALEFDHKPQRYGSQLQCVSGKWMPINLEDPEHVDDRRRSLGLAKTEAQYIQGISDTPCE